MIVNLKQKLLAESHDSENFETFDTNIEKLINITIWKKGWRRILLIGDLGWLSFGSADFYLIRALNGAENNGWKCRFSLLTSCFSVKSRTHRSLWMKVSRVEIEKPPKFDPYLFILLNSGISWNSLAKIRFPHICGMRSCPSFTPKDRYHFIGIIRKLKSRWAKWSYPLFRKNWSPRNHSLVK